jgi:hypothetical protein
VESALDWQTESGLGMYLDVLHEYPTVEQFTDTVSDPTSMTRNVKHLPFTVYNKTLITEGIADRITVVSITGRVILQEKNISSLNLEADEPFTIISIEMGANIYQYKHVNFEY